jgi:TRAP-type C4-dicarboxylate transport system substrate-binding protein
VESYISSVSTGYDSKTYESTKYFYDTQAWLPKNAVFANKKAFDALDPATQSAVMKASTEAEDRGWKTSQEKTEWYKKALTEKGMKIVPPSPKLMADMRQLGGIMLADWQKKAGADGETILAAYNKSKK